MQFRIKKIAKIIEAQVIGDENLLIDQFSSFETADMKTLTFASDIKFLKKLNECNAGAVIIPKDFVVSDDLKIRSVILKTDNPKNKFFKILKTLNPEKGYNKTIAPSACIGKNVKLGQNVSIYNNVYLGNNVTIGNEVVLMPNVFIGDDVIIKDNTIIKPNTTIMDKSEIGSNVIIHSGTVIGSDGFGFTMTNKTHEKIIHTGYVCIGDNVEIGAVNTIDRGTFGKTWLKNGVKTDNLVHIAHNVVIGENSLLTAKVAIAGSAKIGKNVICAGRSGVSGHLTIGDNAIIGPCAGVVSDVSPDSIVSGMPQMPHKLWLKVSTIIPRLPEFRKKIFFLEKRMDKIEKNNKDGV